MNTNTIVKSFAWDFLGKIARQFVGFGIGILLARLLSPKEFGLISMATIFIAISEYFVNAGLSSAIIQKKDITEEHLSSSFYLNFFIALLVAIIFFFAAPLIAQYFNTTQLINVIRVISLKVLISGFTIVQRTVLIKNMKFQILMRASLFGSLFGGIIGVIMAFYGFGVWSLIVQILFSLCIESSIIWFSSNWKPKQIFKPKALRELWQFGGNLFFSGLTNVMSQQLESFVIAKVFSKEILGLFNRARNLNNFVIRYSSESINSVMFPAMSSIKESKNRMVEMGLKGETLVSFSTFALLGLLYLTSEPLILFLLGEKWVGAIAIYKILCLSGFVYPLSVTTLSMIKASGDSKSILHVEIIKNIINISGLAIGFTFGLTGYLISLIFTGVLNVLINMGFAKKSLKITFITQISHIYIYPIIAIVSTIMLSSIPLTSVSNLLKLCILTPLYAVTYALFNFILKTKGLEILISKLTPVISNKFRNKH